MLLEAGFLDLAFTRLEDALAIAPNLSSVRWELARAWALEGRWDIYDQLVGELMKHDDRIIGRVRCEWWRGNLDAVRALREPLETASRGPDPMLMKLVLASMLDGSWSTVRNAVMSRVHSGVSRVRRRNAYVTQLVAETAAFAGDVGACNELLDLAVQQGLFDLHWIDHCPRLDPARGTAAFESARTRIKSRADAILDAYYGDHEPGSLSDTVVI
jgi:serine/threonine-protein kinase